MKPQPVHARHTPVAMIAVIVLGFALSAAMAMVGALPLAAAQPGDLPTDGRGFVNSAARCDAPRTAIAVGRTPKSLIAICADGRGHYQYRGVRLSDRALLELPAAPLANGCFGVRNNEISYTVSTRKLLLTSGLRVVRDETMLQFEDFRTPVVAPVLKTSG